MAEAPKESFANVLVPDRVGMDPEEMEDVDGVPNLLADAAESSAWEEAVEGLEI